jgi:hypothetical protein
MKLLQITILVTLTAMLGCTSIAPGNDPLVVRSVQTVEIAAEVIDGYIHFEWVNRDTLWAVSRDFKRLADKLRDHSVPTMQSLRAATKAYKSNRTEENRASLVTAMAVAQALLTETETHFARALASCNP